MLTKEIMKYIDQSVLCWLATCSTDLVPNVSPKEIFNYTDSGHVIIANIASPKSVRNIIQNKNVCVSFIDILVQKGYQLKGTAEIINTTSKEFETYQHILEKMTKGQFPFSSLTKITIEKATPIIAPSYRFFPDTTTEEAQIESAKKTYLLSH